MSEVSSEAVEAWEKYRDGELWHRNRRQLRKRDFIAGYLAAHQPARVAPSAEDREALALGLWDDGIIRPEWLARQAVDRILDDPILSSQPTVTEVREQTLRSIAAEIPNMEGWNSAEDDTIRLVVRDILLLAARIARTETKGGE